VTQRLAGLAIEVGGGGLELTQRSGRVDRGTLEVALQDRIRVRLGDLLGADAAGSESECQQQEQAWDQGREKGMIQGSSTGIDTNLAQFVSDDLSQWLRISRVCGSPVRVNPAQKYGSP
jgi:hypothetical protein